MELLIALGVQDVLLVSPSGLGEIHQKSPPYAAGQSVYLGV